MARGDSYQLQGQQGGIVLTGADSATGSFRWIQAIEDTVLLCDTGETAGNLTDIINLDGKTLVAGTGLGGKFTKVQISSGTAVVYSDWRMPRGESYLLQGQQGGNVFDPSSGGGVDGRWRAVLAIEDSQMSLNLDNIDNPGSATFDLKAGQVFMGAISYISLSSGIVVAYLDDWCWMLVKTTVGDRSLSWLKGQLGLVNWDIGLRRQPRGQIYFQGNTTSETITETYVKVDNTTTLDGSALYFESPGNNGRLTYVGSQTRFFNVIGTIDVRNTTGASREVSIKLGKNGSVIDATQCNATIPNNGVGKLHSMWILELEKDDYVEVFLATATGEGSKSLIPVRMRMQATCLS